MYDIKECISMIKEFNKDEGSIRTSEDADLAQYKEKYKIGADKDLLEGFYDEKNRFTAELIRVIVNTPSEELHKNGITDIVHYFRTRHERSGTNKSHVCIFTQDGDYFTIVTSLIRKLPEYDTFMSLCTQISAINEVPDKSERISQNYLDFIKINGELEIG